MSDRMSDKEKRSFGEDVPASPSEVPDTARPELRSRRLARRASDSYQPHPLTSWLSRLWRTLAFRPGVYAEMRGDRHATWQASLTWVLASIGPVMGGLTYTGPFASGVFQLFVASTIALVLWTGVVHIASRMLSKTDGHSYGVTVRSVGFSMLPGLGLLIVSWPIFSLWGLGMQIHGFREGVGLTWPRAIITALIPWILFTGLFAVFLAMACRMGAC